MDPDTAPSPESEDATPYEPGPVERAVLADMLRVGKTDVGVRSSLKEMALKLARALDLCSTDDVMTLAKANAELRQTLGKLTDTAGQDIERFEALFRRMSTAVRDASESGEDDSGTERCGHCGRTE